MYYTDVRLHSELNVAVDSYRLVAGSWRWRRIYFRRREAGCRVWRGVLSRVPAAERLDVGARPLEPAARHATRGNDCHAPSSPARRSTARQPITS